MSFVADSVRIGILGDFQPKAPNLPAIEKSVEHASAKLQIAVEAKWIPTPSVLEPNGQKTLESFDGMLKGIEFARRRDWPFLGTCGGFQYALIECARNVLGIKDADSAENNSG